MRTIILVFGLPMLSAAYGALAEVPRLGWKIWAIWRNESTAYLAELQSTRPRGAAVVVSFGRTNSQQNRSSSTYFKYSFRASNEWDSTC